MDYLTVEEARQLPGLRLALTTGVPGPWSEAAKALFRHHGVDFVSVAQEAGADNTELVAWTGHRNAPVAVYENEPPRVRWLEILDLAERLGSGPSLVPTDRDDRIFMVGLINEIAGEKGLAWNARTLMFHAMASQGGSAASSNPMFGEYRYEPGEIDTNIGKIEDFLGYLADRIKAQAGRGSAFLVGDTPTAADVYWAYFSNMLEPLPPEQCPMPEYLRGVVASSISGYDPVLIEHRNRFLADHLELPLSF